LLTEPRGRLATRISELEREIGRALRLLESGLPHCAAEILRRAAPGGAERNFQAVGTAGDEPPPEPRARPPARPWPAPGGDAA